MLFAETVALDQLLLFQKGAVFPVDVAFDLIFPLQRRGSPL